GKMGGASKVQENYRLFMVPGMNHCGGGDGTDQFDMLTALENWVEKKQAPASIDAARNAGRGGTARTRGLCPYPQVATYKGSGSVDEAANFVCKYQKSVARGKSDQKYRISLLTYPSSHRKFIKYDLNGRILK